MILSELVAIQKQFDSKHKGRFKWNSEISDETISLLGFTMLALSGEVGEASNIVKKIWRGDNSLDDKREELQEEIADIFSYLLKLCYQLDFDLEKTYCKKLKRNVERFANYANEEQ